MIWEVFSFHTIFPFTNIWLLAFFVLRFNQKRRESCNLITEKASLIDPQGRTAPARSLGSTRKLALTFMSVDVNDDIATVVLKDGTYTAELTLVFVDGKWYIAGFKGISLNF